MVASKVAAMRAGNPTGANQHQSGTSPIGEVPKPLSHKDRAQAAAELNEAQRGMVGAKLANLQKGGAGGYKTDSPIGLSPSIFQKQAAEMLNVGVDSIKRSKQVMRTGIPELQDMQMSGEVAAVAAAMTRKTNERW